MKKLFLYFPLVSLFSQEIPIESIHYKTYEFEIDRGLKWNDNSSISSPRWQDIDDRLIVKDTTIISFDMNYYARQKGDAFNSSIGILSRLYFKKYFYTYLYARIVTDANAFPRYTGIPRDIERFGFNSGEVDMSGIGYDNKQFIFQIGRLNLPRLL